MQTAALVYVTDTILAMFHMTSTANSFPGPSFVPQQEETMDWKSFDDKQQNPTGINSAAPFSFSSTTFKDFSSGNGLASGVGQLSVNSGVDEMDMDEEMEDVFASYPASAADVFMKDAYPTFTATTSTQYYQDGEEMDTDEDMEDGFASDPASTADVFMEDTYSATTHSTLYYQDGDVMDTDEAMEDAFACNSTPAADVFRKDAYPTTTQPNSFGSFCFQQTKPYPW